MDIHHDALKMARRSWTGVQRDGKMARPELTECSIRFAVLDLTSVTSRSPDGRPTYFDSDSQRRIGSLDLCGRQSGMRAFAYRRQTIRPAMYSKTPRWVSSVIDKRLKTPSLPGLKYPLRTKFGSFRAASNPS